MENLIFSEKTLRWLIDNRYLKDMRKAHKGDYSTDLLVANMKSLQEDVKITIIDKLKNNGLTKDDINYLKALQKRKTTRGIHPVGQKIGDCFKDSNVLLNALIEAYIKYRQKKFQCDVLGIEDLNKVESDLWKSENIELVLQTLPELEQMVLKNYYALEGTDAKNLREIAKELETSIEMVRGVLDKALRHLRYPKKLSQLKGKNPVSKEEIDEAKRKEEEKFKKSQEDADYDRFEEYEDFDYLFDEDENILNI